MPRYLVSFVLAAALAACAVPQQIALGTARADVIGRLGQPTRVVPLQGGRERLQYSLQPAGQLAWMVDLDTIGRVTSVRQVLADDEFKRIVPGEWTRSDVEREFGPPALWNGRVMTYRWRDLHGLDMFCWVYVDPQGMVRDTRAGIELPGKSTDI